MSSIPVPQCDASPQDASTVTQIDVTPAPEQPTPKQKVYGVARVAGKTDKEARELAAALVGKRAPGKLGKRAMTMAVRDIMEEVGLTAEYRIEKLKKLIDEAPPSQQLGALKEAFHLADDYPTEKKAIIHTSLSEYKELMKEAQQIQEELIELESKMEPSPAVLEPQPEEVSPALPVPGETRPTPNNFSFGSLPDGFRSSL